MSIIIKTKLSNKRMSKKEKERNNKISKTMSYILRHGLILLGLDFDNKGRITIDTLLNIKQMKDYMQLMILLN